MTVRELNGDSQATVTFGPDGEVLSVAVTEPRFTAADKALLLASRRLEREPRNSHGFTIAEVTDPKNQGKFTVPLPSTDFSEDALSKAQKKYSTRWPDADMGVLLWSVEMKD